MVVVRLLIIVAVLLFGKENTKDEIKAILVMMLFLGLLGQCMG